MYDHGKFSHDHGKFSHDLGKFSHDHGKSSHDIAKFTASSCHGNVCNFTHAQCTHVQSSTVFRLNNLKDNIHLYTKSMACLYYS